MIWKKCKQFVVWKKYTTIAEQFNQEIWEEKKAVDIKECEIKVKEMRKKEIQFLIRKFWKIKRNKNGFAYLLLREFQYTFNLFLYFLKNDPQLEVFFRFFSRKYFSFYLCSYGLTMEDPISKFFKLIIRLLVCAQLFPLIYLSIINKRKNPT